MQLPDPVGHFSCLADPLSTLTPPQTPGFTAFRKKSPDTGLNHQLNNFKYTNTHLPDFGHAKPEFPALMSLLDFSSAKHLPDLR